MPKQLQGVFITGTGTDVGKTIATASLNLALWTWHSNSFKAYLALKPIQTGVMEDKLHLEADSAIYNKALSSVKIPKEFLPTTLNSFDLPASPHLAAKQENKNLCVQDLCAEIKNLCREDTALLIEGAGGVCVPINSGETSLDFMQALGLPVILVMQNTLGALNHTLLSIEVLQNSGLHILAIISIEKENSDITLIKQDNIQYLEDKFPHIPIFSLPYLEGLAKNNAVNVEQVWQEAAEYLAPLAKLLVDTWLNENSNSTTSDVNLLDWDREHLWHPYTSAISPLPVYEVSHTKGMHIYLQNKKEPLVDGMASWWCAVHGYGRDELVQAAKMQIELMPHVMFGGLTHAPAVRAAQKLLSLLHTNEQAKSLSRIFWADSGSVAVEVALKMALQYQQGRGQNKRTKFLSPRGGYYGDTMGAMSVCDPINGMHTLFNHVLSQHIFISRPQCPFDGSQNNNFNDECLQELEQAFRQYGEQLAAVIIEPIVQGAGGMWFYDPRYLIRLHELCQSHGVLLIFDEIATGFGRTGKLFAAQWANIVPDICCVGKALTGGFMSLAATICTEDVALGICADNQVFMHGPTFMANALACAVAEASLDIFVQNKWQAQVSRIEQELKQGLAPCRGLEGVKDVRVLGAIGVVEMQKNVNTQALQEFFVQNNIWVRPFSNLIYIMPPYIASTAHIELLTSVITKSIVKGLYK